MENITLKPMLAARDRIALTCATARVATDWTGMAGTDRVSVTGMHVGFARSAGSQTWSPPT